MEACACGLSARGRRTASLRGTTRVRKAAGIKKAPMSGAFYQSETSYSFGPRDARLRSFSVR